jgi:hypothetical protein
MPDGCKVLENEVEVLQGRLVPCGTNVSNYGLEPSFVYMERSPIRHCSLLQILGHSDAHFGCGKGAFVKNCLMNLERECLVLH